MKKALQILTVLFLVTASMSIKAGNNLKPQLYPSLQQYFSSLNTADIANDHKLALQNLKSLIIQSGGSSSNKYVLVTCADNAFTSQAAQIILETLANASQYKKLIVLSAGYNITDIDSRLLSLLTKVGYKVTPVSSNANGKAAYKIEYSDAMPALTVFAKQFNDPSIPKTDFYLFNTCTSDEKDCIDISGAAFKQSLPYKSEKGIQDDKELETEFNTIATEMSDAVKEANKVLGK